MLLAFGIVCALLEATRSGQGQVVDAAIVDGAALLTTLIHELRNLGEWSDERGTNMLDSGAHFYDVYEASDGRWISIGAIEPQFYAELIERLGLDADEFAAQMDRERWPVLREQLARVFRSRTRDEWCALLEGSDVCFSPVLSLDEAPRHAHNAARGTFVGGAGGIEPAPAPRFSRTQPSPPGAAQREARIAEWGLSQEELEELGYRPPG